MSIAPSGALPEPWSRNTGPSPTGLSPATVTAGTSRSAIPDRTASPSPAPPPAAHDFASVPTPPNSDNVASTPPRPDETVPLNVLVVDDDKLTRMMMGRLLKRLGHKVETAENGQIALEKITDSFHLSEDAVPVDVVFLDK